MRIVASSIRRACGEFVSPASNWPFCRNLCACVLGAAAVAPPAVAAAPAPARMGRRV